MNVAENGSAGGLKGLRPQHLKDMMGVELGEYALLIRTRLRRFTDYPLNGKAPNFIIPILYGAALRAFNEKKFSIRPIAVGCTYRRLENRMCKNR